MNKEKLKCYESPKAEVIEIESQGVLCVSGETSTGSFGTTNMNMSSGHGW